jgi:hypothetical protein
MDSKELLDILPGVPVVESPFFEDILATDYFSESEKEIARQLHEQGYAVIDFPDAEFHQRGAIIGNHLIGLIRGTNTLRHQLVRIQLA